MDTLRIACPDLNGAARGKRLPAAALPKVEKGEARMPLSACNLDIFGRDIENSPLVFDSGDADGTLQPTGRGPVPMPWLPRPEPLYPVMMMQNGAPFAGDARAALVAVLDRLATHGLAPHCATEMEFTLLDGDTDGAAHRSAARDPVSGRPQRHADICSLDTLDRFSAFFDDLYDGAEAMGIPAQSALSEAGVGQFEVDLAHRDALRAADDAWLFKMLVKGMARKHGMTATFLAKPDPEDAGNGMHVHCSMMQADGRNLFDDGTEAGSDALRQAVAGCLAGLAESTLIFAPHAGSYDRFVPGAHAPTGISWGYDNRTTALRIPLSPPAARRIEHRVAGADSNPYLLFAALLGAMLYGIEGQMEAPAPLTGNAYTQELPSIPTDWKDAIAAFAEGRLMQNIFDPLLIDNLVRTKRQEQAHMEGLSRAEIADLYLTRA
ncbi:MAG: glutamine synthetase family protein [Oceanicola sp.]|nr:glutamine synthetase family protein [Oceanicola sp.]